MFTDISGRDNAVLYLPSAWGKMDKLIKRETIYAVERSLEDITSFHFAAQDDPSTELPGSIQWKDRFHYKTGKI